MYTLRTSEGEVRKTNKLGKVNIITEIRKCAGSLDHKFLTYWLLLIPHPDLKLAGVLL